jgi:sec-independent protein translocase protein TatC
MTAAIPPPDPQAPPRLHYSEHLAELRTRLLRSLLAVVLVLLLLMPWAKQNYQLLSQPLIALLPANSSMIATDVLNTFLSPFKLNLYLAVFITMPFSLYQLWRFIAPALYHSEKSIGARIVILSYGLFFIGIALSYLLVLPAALEFFILAAPAHVLPMTDIASYLDFCLKLFLAFGLVFQIPLVTYVVILTGVVSIAQLQASRKYIIVLFFFIAMVITPPDVLSMLALALPMCLLFEIGLYFSKISLKKYK